MEYEKFRPSNGSEGESFYTAWCAECERERPWIESGGEGCEIYAATLMLDIDDPLYPSEWIYDEFQNPFCNAFVLSGSVLPVAKQLEEAGQLRLFPRVAK